MRVDGSVLVAAATGAVGAAGVLMVIAGLVPVAVVVEERDVWRTRWGRLRDTLAHRQLILAAVGVGVVVGVVTRWPVAGLAAAVATGGIPRLLTSRQTRHQLDRLEALEAWTRRLADLLGSGAGGLEQAITASVRTCPAPLTVEVQALARRLRQIGPEAALRAFADDLAGLGSPAGDIVAAALILRVRRGGRGLRPVLEALASDVADLVRARRAVEADRAKPRSNVRVLIGLTAVVLAVTMVFARDYLSPFTSAAGQLVLAVIAVLFGLGMWLMSRITRLPEAVRILPAAAPGRSAVVGRGAWWA